MEIVKLACENMYSEATEARVEREQAAEKEREELALELGNTKERVKKYDRLGKRNKLKVSMSMAGGSVCLAS